MKKSIEMSKTSFVLKMRGLPFNCSIEDILQFFNGIDIIEEGIYFCKKISINSNKQIKKVNI